jgi:hypothetical protein
MCRNIKTLYNFDPPATDAEIRAASEQFVRKISGYTHPSIVNEKAFNLAIDEISHTAYHLLKDLKTTAEPRDREVEAVKAHKRALKRFGTAGN